MRKKQFLLTLDLLPVILCVSCKACSLHFTSSVGHKVREEKNAAKNPAVAFAKGLRSSIFYKTVKDLLGFPVSE